MTIAIFWLHDKHVQQLLRISRTAPKRWFISVIPTGHMLISCYLTGHMLINMNMHKINYMQANHENVNDAVTREQQLI